jgi:hypothetical protein
MTSNITFSAATGGEVGAGASVAAAGALVGSGGASVAPQAASVTPAAVIALARKKSRRLSLFSAISPSFVFYKTMYARHLSSTSNTTSPPFLR